MADKKQITDTVFQMANPLALNCGCFVYDVEFKKEGSDYVLRVILDVEDDENASVSIDQCENVSRALSDLLDASDPIEQEYMLEVTSPGIDRPLKKESDFERFNGRSIDIGLYKAVNGSKLITGILSDYHDGIIFLETNEGIKEFARNETSSVKLSIIW